MFHIFEVVVKMGLRTSSRNEYMNYLGSCQDERAVWQDLSGGKHRQIPIEKDITAIPRFARDQLSPLF